MRFLHTADWHVGKAVPGAGLTRAPEHEAVLAEIAAIATDQKVDLILVAGDMFDSASPGPESERIVFAALLKLGRVAPVIAIAGNHDNDRRLKALAPLLELAGVTVVAALRPECISMEVGSGEIAKIAVIPWLSQRHIIKATQLMSTDADDLRSQYASRMKSIIEALAGQFDARSVNLFAAHMTVAGSLLGGGERTAQTIFDYHVPSTHFPASCHYVALGHMHKTQSMPGPCPMHYCGAPMHLDFSDSVDERNVIIVEAAPGKPAIVETVPLVSGRKLRTIRGTLGQLTSMREEMGDDYLRVIVDEPARVGLADEIYELFSHAVKVKIERRDALDEPARPDRSGVSPHDLFIQYLTEKDIDDPRMVKMFDELYEEVHETASA